MYSTDLTSPHTKAWEPETSSFPTLETLIAKSGVAAHLAEPLRL